MTEQTLQRVFSEMLYWFSGDPKRCQHFIKVEALSGRIARGEGMTEDERRRLCCAAILHDIGIRPGEEKYGRCDGKTQEREGPAPARALLERVGGCTAEEIDRVCFLIAHHHTYDAIDGLDYQILVEADFLVNLYEDGVPPDAVQQARARMFSTETGKTICDAMYALGKDAAT